MPLDGAQAYREVRQQKARRRGLSLFQVMPREMHFGAAKATSIDLCVRDLVLFSRFRGTTRILAEKTEEDFAGFTIDHLPPARRGATSARANHVAAAALREPPDLIIVQQHLPTAAAIAAKLPGAKVVLHTHNFQKSYEGGIRLQSMIRRAARTLRYNRLAGIIHVSDACERAFDASWPSVGLKSCVINNGLDFADWRPASVREPVILCVGRCAPEKGILEAAQAMRMVLPRFPGWRARFILSGIEVHPDYFQRTRETLSLLGAQAEIQVQRPFEEIKHATEQASIALVPSKWLEPFGRTALEAHAGGAALVSSGTGGLSEISGDAAAYLTEVSAGRIANAVETMIANPDFRTRLAHQGAKRARYKFDIRIQAARLDAYCEAIVHDTRSNNWSTRPGHAETILSAAE